MVDEEIVRSNTLKGVVMSNRESLLKELAKVEATTLAKLTSYYEVSSGLPQEEARLRAQNRIEVARQQSIYAPRLPFDFPLDKGLEQLTYIIWAIALLPEEVEHEGRMPLSAGDYNTFVGACT